MQPVRQILASRRRVWREYRLYSPHALDAKGCDARSSVMSATQGVTSTRLRPLAFALYKAWSALFKR